MIILTYSMNASELRRKSVFSRILSVITMFVRDLLRDMLHNSFRNCSEDFSRNSIQGFSSICSQSSFRDFLAFFRGLVRVVYGICTILPFRISAGVIARFLQEHFLGYLP